MAENIRKGKPLWAWIDEFNQRYPGYDHKIVIPGSPAERCNREEGYVLTGVPDDVIDSDGFGGYEVMSKALKRRELRQGTMNPIKDFVQRVIGRWRINDVTGWQEYSNGRVDICCELDSTINTLRNAFPDNYLVIADWESGVVTIGKLEQEEESIDDVAAQ